MDKSSNIMLRRILSQNPKKSLSDTSLTPAGVMLLVHQVAGIYCILLNIRSSTLDQHQGEVAFPGGRMENSDKTLLHTALRETHEEMGIQPDDIEVLGALDDVRTKSKYIISPYVGTFTYPYHFTPNKHEVAQVLQVPLAKLRPLNLPQNTADTDRDFLRNECSYTYHGNRIFGATAKILQQFLSIIGDLDTGKFS